MTCLGPALLLSAVFASGMNVGSKVIMCTDGLANKGFGKFELEKDRPAAKPMYEKIGKYAADNGVVLSIIGLIDKELEFNLLYPAVTISKGGMYKRNILELHEDLKKLIEETFIARNAELWIKLPKCLEFSGYS